MTAFPWNTPMRELEKFKPDGILLSNGPGNPTDVQTVVELGKELKGKYPIFGICLGHQIISLAYGAKTYKLRFGHRGGNHPIKNLKTRKIEITSQNHSYTVDAESLADTRLKVTHLNLLDQTVEGVACEEDKVFSVQYHPESAPGPQDSGYLFDQFIKMMEGTKFDYAGTQACLALKEEGYEVVLCNSNPATIMTDLTVAAKVYMEPLALEYVAKIVRHERPDAIVPGIGGQTGLNLAMQLEKKGILKECQVELLGTCSESIERAEDREQFKKLCEELGEPILPSVIANTVDDAIRAAGQIGYPVVLRPAFTLEGTGGGFADNEQEFRNLIKNAIALSPVHQVLVEKSIKGFKEIEYEVIRDASDTAITAYPNDFKFFLYSCISISSALSRTDCSSSVTFSRSYGRYAVTGVKFETVSANKCVRIFKLLISICSSEIRSFSSAGTNKPCCAIWYSSVFGKRVREATEIKYGLS